MSVVIHKTTFPLFSPRIARADWRASAFLGGSIILDKSDDNAGIWMIHSRGVLIFGNLYGSLVVTRRILGEKDIIVRVIDNHYMSRGYTRVFYTNSTVRRSGVF